MTNEEQRRMAEMLGNVIDQLWANAVPAPRHSAKPEPVSRLGPKGECRLSLIKGGKE
jgi:hypothetical protein